MLYPLQLELETVEVAWGVFSVAEKGRSSYDAAPFWGGEIRLLLTDSHQAGVTPGGSGVDA